MASIHTETVSIQISRLTKSAEADLPTLINDDLKATLEEVVQKLIGEDTAIVEIVEE